MIMSQNTSHTLYQIQTGIFYEGWVYNAQYWKQFANRSEAIEYGNHLAEAIGPEFYEYEFVRLVELDIS